MSSSPENSYFSTWNEDFDQVVEEEFERVYEECLDNFSPVRERRKAKKKRDYIERGREDGDIRLWNYYFSDHAIYHDTTFQRWFRMNKSLLMRIVQRLSAELPYFQRKQDAPGRLSLSGLQKCTAAIRMLAYGSAADAVDEYIRIGETIALRCLENFVNRIIYFYEDEYLRRPKPEDLQRLLNVGEARRFPGMIGSIDCMYWEWKNCPTAWKGQYSRGLI